MKRNEIEPLLPEIFQRVLEPGSPLGAILDVMESMHRPAERVLAEVETIFSPDRAPESFVPLLAVWVDLDRFFSPGLEDASEQDGFRPPLPSGLGRLRQLIATAAQLSRWRGTARGLTGFLGTATGLSPFEIEQEVPGADGRIRPFHIRVLAPAEAVRYRPLIERIVAQEKPAYVTYQLDFGPSGRGEQA